MKNRSDPHWSADHIKKNMLVLLTGPFGFSGYYVDRFNDVYSVRLLDTPLAPWENRFPSGAVVERLNLFDDTGKRRQVSRRKVLTDTLGKVEFERREVSRGNKHEILLVEAKKGAIWREKCDRETEAQLKEQCKKLESLPRVPLLSLDPFMREIVQDAQQRKADNPLGELF